MRYWLLVLMLAIALPLFPIIRRSFVPAASVASKFIHRTPQSIVKQVHTSVEAGSIMTEAIPQQNPLPVLSKAAPADPIKAQELPKLSTEDFRIYNRLAIMMDAYVS